MIRVPIRSGGIMARRISLVVLILSISIGSGHLMERRVAQERAEQAVAVVEPGNI
jgi:hypothetical protein